MATAKVVFASEPKDFDGTPAQVENFMNSITLYFFAYSAKFAKDDRKVLYHLSKCKEGNAAIFARNYIATNTTVTPATANTPASSTLKLGSYYDFETEFRTSFTDPNLACNKHHLLDTMQQGNHTAKDFFNEFDLVCQQAGYGDAVTHVLYLISLLEKSALNPILIQKIYQTVPVPNTYAAFKASALQHDSQWRQARAVTAIRQGKPVPKLPSTMSTSTTTSKTNGNPTSEEVPMDVDAQSGRRGRKGKKGKGKFLDKVKDKIRCFNCGQFGHYAKECKNERITWKYDIRAMSADEKRALLDEFAETEEYENF